MAAPTAKSWSNLAQTSSSSNSKSNVTSARPSGGPWASIENQTFNEYSARLATALEAYSSRQLSGIAEESIHSYIRPRGLHNSGNTCFANSVWQAMLSSPAVTELTKTICESAAPPESAMRVLTSRIHQIQVLQQQRKQEEPPHNKEADTSTNTINNLMAMAPAGSNHAPATASSSVSDSSLPRRSFLASSSQSLLPLLRLSNHMHAFVPKPSLASSSSSNSSPHSILTSGLSQSAPSVSTSSSAISASPSSLPKSVLRENESASNVSSSSTASESPTKPSSETKSSSASSSKLQSRPASAKIDPKMKLIPSPKPAAKAANSNAKNLQQKTSALPSKLETKSVPPTPQSTSSSTSSSSGAVSSPPSAASKPSPIVFSPWLQTLMADLCATPALHTVSSSSSLSSSAWFDSPLLSERCFGPLLQRFWKSSSSSSSSSASKAASSGQRLVGKQEDAQEFYTFFIDSIHTEMQQLLDDARLIKRHAASALADSSSQPSSIHQHGLSSEPVIPAGGEPTSHTSGSVVASRSPEAAQDDAEEGWHEVDGRNRARLIASEVHVEESPIQRIFAGRFRSVLKKQGMPDTISYQPFLSLPLDISSDEISSLDDALDAFFAPEPVFGFKKPGTNQEIRASRCMSIDRLPQTLVIQLKRFWFDENGPIKIQKNIQFDHLMQLPANAVFGIENPSPSLSTPGFQFRLRAVILHHGNKLANGHYTALCRYSFPSHLQDEPAVAASSSASASAWSAFTSAKSSASPSNVHASSSSNSTSSSLLASSSNAASTPEAPVPPEFVDQWLNFNDDDVQRVSSDFVLQHSNSCKAYLLFYERI